MSGEAPPLLKKPRSPVNSNVPSSASVPVLTANWTASSAVACKRTFGTSSGVVTVRANSAGRSTPPMKQRALRYSIGPSRREPA